MLSLKKIFQRIFKPSVIFITFQINTVTTKKVIPKTIIFFVKRYLFFRFKKVNYFESYTNKQNESTLIFGSAPVRNKGNRNVIIFLLELYAHLNDPELIVTQDFKQKIKRVGEYEVVIYRVPKFYIQ